MSIFNKKNEWGEAEDITKMPDVEAPESTIESILRDNDKEIMINQIRIRIIQRHIATEKKDELLLQLNNALRRFQTERKDLQMGKEMLLDWLKEVKK